MSSLTNLARVLLRTPRVVARSSTATQLDNVGLGRVENKEASPGPLFKVRDAHLFSLVHDKPARETAHAMSDTR